MRKKHSESKKASNALKLNWFQHCFAWLRHLLLSIRCFFANRLKTFAVSKGMATENEQTVTTPNQIVLAQTTPHAGNGTEATNNGAYSDFTKKLKSYWNKRQAAHQGDPVSWLRQQKLALVEEALSVAKSASPAQAFTTLDQGHTRLCTTVRKQHRFLSFFVSVDGTLGQLIKDFRVTPLHEAPAGNINISSALNPR
ncbi:MAG: hypothetical protein V4490_08685 [Pseudomonadota bacterium]